MSQPIVIPCELTIIPGGGSRQNKIILTASGETVLEEYQDSVSAGVRETVGLLCQGHSRLLSKFGQALAK